MPKKSRTPPPPRRVQAPRTRSDLSDDAARRRLRWLVAFAAAGILGLVIVGAVIAFSRGDDEGGSTDGYPAALEQAGCKLQTFPGLGRTHIGLNTDDPSKVKVPKYNSNPPTSGPHYGIPAVWDIYDSPVLAVQEVHNLEHGGVIVHYGPRVPEADVERIRAFYEEDTEAMLVAPLPSLGDKITLSAWRHLATCPRFDEKAFEAFRDKYRFHGPESPQIPKGSESLKRGNA